MAGFRPRAHRAIAGVVMVGLVVSWAVGGAPAASAAGQGGDVAELAVSGWIWPVQGPRLVRAFVAPAYAYGPGHRGIDIEASGPAAVVAPANGTVAFSGPVAGRGILTIDHGNGLVTTLEPVESELKPGDPVVRGDPVGTITLGGHSAPGSVHLGVRLHGEYINPLLLLGGVPLAVLLPCCG